MGRKLYRSISDRKIFGVCGGLCEYFNIDSTFFRILFIMLAVCFLTLGVWIYLILALVLKHDDGFTSPEYHSKEKLVKRKEGKFLFGVCSGLADYFDIDLIVLRLIVLFGALLGFGIMFYIVAVFVMPSEEKIYGKKNEIEKAAESAEAEQAAATETEENGKAVSATEPENEEIGGAEKKDS